MARGVYRAYLYFVWTAMLEFAAGAAAVLLTRLLALTPLRGMLAQPDSVSVRQSVVFWAVAWVVAGTVGGLHYWLIRLDERSDPAANSGGARSFFLNFSQATAAFVAVYAGAIGISSLGSPYGSTGATGIGIAVAYGALFATLGAERRRGRPAPGAPRTMERLNLYATPLAFVVVPLASYALSAMQASVGTIEVATGAYKPCAAAVGACTYEPSATLGGNWGAVAWVVLGWLIYAWIARRDVGSTLRLVMHLAGVGYGTIYLLIGVRQGVELLLRSWLEPGTQYDLVNAGVIPPLVFGVVVIGAYMALLRAEQALLRPGRATVRLGAVAVVGVLAAGVFWSGVAATLVVIYEVLFEGHVIVVAADWAVPLSMLVTGLIYLPQDAQLRRTSSAGLAQGPRRAFETVMLAGGFVGGAIGLAAALFAGASALAGVALGGWTDILRDGLAAAVAGACVIVIYGRSVIVARRAAATEGSHVGVPPTEAADSSAQSSLEPSLEQILDGLVAGRMSRDEAAAAIRRHGAREP